MRQFYSACVGAVLAPFAAGPPCLAGVALSAGVAAHATTAVAGVSNIATTIAHGVEDDEANQIEIAEAPNFLSITQDDRYVAGVVRRSRAVEHNTQLRAREIAQAATNANLEHYSSSSSGEQPAARLRSNAASVRRPHRTEGATWVAHPNLNPSDR